MESKMDDINKRLPGRRTSAALSTLDANNFRTFEDSGRYGSAVLIFWPSVLCLDVLCCYMGHVLNCKAPTVPVSRGERPESASHILPRNRSIRLSLYSPPSSYLHPANYHTGIAHHIYLKVQRSECQQTTSARQCPSELGPPLITDGFRCRNTVDERHRNTALVDHPLAQFQRCILRNARK